MKKDVEKLRKFRELTRRVKPNTKEWADYEKGLEEYPELNRRVTMGLHSFYKGDLKSMIKAVRIITGVRV